MRAANPTALGVGAVFVLEGALDHINFLATKVGVAVELGARLPAHQGDAFG